MAETSAAVAETSAAPAETSAALAEMSAATREMTEVLHRFQGQTQYAVLDLMINNCKRAAFTTTLVGALA